MGSVKTTEHKKGGFLLSTDSLSGYGLDLIFELASELWFDGIDLAIWKNFDAWHIAYVHKLIEKHNIPVKVIQISRDVNIKEMNQAVELARSLWADTITINAPELFNMTSARFLKSHLLGYKTHNKGMKFSIINPENVNYFGIVPKYYFQDMVQIIRKYKMYLGLDIANIEEELLEHQFMRKMSTFLPYLSVVYLSDVDKHGKKHLPLGEGELKLAQLLKKFKGLEYEGWFSLKLDLNKKDLSDIEKVELILKKCKAHFVDNYENIVIE